jgi:hypothetical protein
MARDAQTHDVVLACEDGSKRKFRIYGRSMPAYGHVITLPVDGHLIRARVDVRSETAEMDQSVAAELVELVE